MPQPTTPDSPILLVGLGEALFDCFPDRRVLGGAPINLAVHANALLRPVGGKSTVVTRVGTDELGDELIEALKDKGFSPAYAQRDNGHATGMVGVDLDGEGHASYTIHENAAWDHLRFDIELAKLAAACRAVCFGTLAQRHPVARAAVYGFLDAAPQAIRFLDVNLRKPHYSVEILRQSLTRATVAKLNEYELPLVCGLLGLDAPTGSACDGQAHAMINQFGLSLLALTRGARGTVLYRADRRVEGTPVTLQRSPGADSVGAGDACSAALVTGLLLNLPDQETADLANRVGAFVAGQPGATPLLPPELLDAIPQAGSVAPDEVPDQTMRKAQPRPRPAGTTTNEP